MSQLEIKPNEYSFFEGAKFLVSIPKEISIKEYMHTMDGDHPEMSDKVWEIMNLVGVKDATWSGGMYEESLEVPFVHIGHAKTFKRMVEETLK
jgi:hypothetical protein